MKYIITALDAEARVLIEHYSLKRNHALPYPLYRNDDTILMVCGMGKMNALMATSALLGYRIPGSGDILLNVGICGAPQTFPIGEALLIHQILEGERRYYPDILYTHTLRESAILCVDTPQSKPAELPVDMESAGVFSAASKFFKLHQMAFLKIVSDHFEPHSVTKESVLTLMESHTITIAALIESLGNTCATPVLFTPQEAERIDRIKSYFTHAQGAKLDDALCYFRLRSPEKPLPILVDEIPTSKRERSALHEHLIRTLVS